MVLDDWAPPETLALLASIGEPRIEVVNRPETFLTLSRRHLGYSSLSRVIADMNPALTKGLGTKEIASFVIPSNSSIFVPDVAPKPLSRRVIVPVGTSAYAWTSAFYRDVGDDTLKSIALASKMQRAELDFLKAQTHLTLPRPRSIHVLRLPAGTNAEEVLTELRSTPGVGLVTLNGRAASLLDPVAVDPKKLSKLDKSWFAKSIHADQITADDLKLTSPVVVAVLDSGLDFSHPWFAGNVWDNVSESVDAANFRGKHGYDFARRQDSPDDTHKGSHGTHVSGIASGRVFGGLPAFSTKALDSHIKVMVLRVADDFGDINIEAIMSALEYAATNGAKIVSGSWTTIESKPLKDYLERYQGILAIVAAGNGEVATVDGKPIEVGYNIDKHPTFPASFKLANTVVVGANDETLGAARFSNYSTAAVHLFAPGVGIQSAVRGAQAGDPATAARSGTSQAAPFVTLTAALIMAKNGLLPMKSVRDRLLYTGDVDDPAAGSVGGRLNMLRAISVDTDLLELTDRTVLRGELQMPSVTFAATAPACDKAQPLAVTNERIGRLIVNHTKTSSRLYTATGIRDGWICDSSIAIKTAGRVIRKPINEVTNVTWRGIYGR